MGVYVDFKKNVILREIWEKGLAEGLADGIAEGEVGFLVSQLGHKFGPIPAWTASRLKKATSEQRKQWNLNLLTAETLEEAIGRK